MDQFSRELAETPPQYCPRCGTAPRVERPLCPDCGETLARQAYCGVCERFWKLAEGVLCPKHDLPLGPGPPPRWSVGPVQWETVARFHHPAQGEGPRLRLEAEGIPAFLDGVRTGGDTMHHSAAGGVRLQVPRELLAEARDLLDQRWAPPAESDDDLDDAWDELAPEPGARRRAVMKAAIILILLLPLARALLALVLGLFV